MCTVHPGLQNDKLLSLKIRLFTSLMFSANNKDTLMETMRSHALFGIVGKDIITSTSLKWHAQLWDRYLESKNLPVCFSNKPDFDLRGFIDIDNNTLVVSFEYISEETLEETNYKALVEFEKIKKEILVLTKGLEIIRVRIHPADRASQYFEFNFDMN